MILLLRGLDCFLPGPPQIIHLSINNVYICYELETKFSVLAFSNKTRLNSFYCSYPANGECEKNVHRTLFVSSEVESFY